MTSTTQACQHLWTAPDLEVLYTLDQHVHLTDGLVRCKTCQACYLIELVDLSAHLGAFRVSAISESAVQATIVSLNKGSCDINRATNEVFSLSASACEIEGWLVMEHGRFVRMVKRPPGITLPKRSWRTLPCDGALIDALL